MCWQAGPVGTAFQYFVVAPAITTNPELPAMQGSYDTPRGLVEISWATTPAMIGSGRAGGGQFVLNITAPPNTRATTRLPLRGRDGIAATRCFESGALLWDVQVGVPGLPAEGLVVTGTVDAGAALEVAHGSGMYEFLVEFGTGSI